MRWWRLAFVPLFCGLVSCGSDDSQNNKQGGSGGTHAGGSGGSGGFAGDSGLGGDGGASGGAQISVGDYKVRFDPQTQTIELWRADALLVAFPPQSFVLGTADEVLD